MKAPLVSAVLPFCMAGRLNLVRKAVNNFIRQHYTPYELVVVNSTDVDVLTNAEMDTEAFREAGCRVLEVRAPTGLNAAAMRNRGIEAAHGDWIFPIDDDDWCNPSRLQYQMAHRVFGHPCLLRFQLRVDVSPSLQQRTNPDGEETFKPLLHLLRIDDGIPSTILFPRFKNDSKELWLYNESLNTGEHDELLARMKRDGFAPVVCDNSHSPFVQGMQWPILSIAIYHANNELTYEQFFQKLTKPVDTSMVPAGLLQPDMDQLRVVLQSYNFRIK